MKSTENWNNEKKENKVRKFTADIKKKTSIFLLLVQKYLKNICKLNAKNITVQSQNSIKCK